MSRKARLKPGVSVTNEAERFTANVGQLLVVSILLLRYPIVDIPISSNQGNLQVSETKLSKEVTREKFASFLEWLNPDRDAAGEEYERLRFRLCTFFSQRQCRFPDELADETINRVILKISEEEIENKIAYCYGVARNVYRESLRKERTHLDIDDVTVAAKAPEEQSFSSECLDKCLEKLPSDSRNLLLEYFSEAKLAKINLHRRISESLETTQTALRMRVMRTKHKLKVCVQDCIELTIVT